MSGVYNKRFADLIGINDELPQESGDEIAIRVMEQGGLHFGEVT